MHAARTAAGAPPLHAPSAPEAELPEQIEEYRMVRRLGRGAMGQVFLAVDTKLDRHVAVKVLAIEPRAAARERFLQEARAVARLSHANVVTIHRVGEVDGRPYIVCELVRGQSLDVLAKPVPWRQALELARGLARGLAAAHAAGVLHRDIKPANAMLAVDGNVKLLDFGLAKLLDQSSDAPGATDAAPDPGDEPTLTRTGALLGTPLYMAPEAWRGDSPSASMDVYSLGAVVYELCTGERSHAGTRLDEIRRSAEAGNAPPLTTAVRGIDAGFAAAVHRCLAVDPAARFASAVELSEALDAIAVDAPGARRRASRSPRLAIVVAALALAALAAGIAAFALARRPDAPGTPTYAAVSKIESVTLFKDRFASSGRLEPPLPNAKLFKPGEILGIALAIDGSGGDTVQLQLIDPDEHTNTWFWTVPARAHHTPLTPIWRETVGKTVGRWELRVSVNGTLAATSSYGVSNLEPGRGIYARHGAIGTAYQDVFVDVATAGYRPVHVDAFDIDGTPYFNAIFHANQGGLWLARHHLDLPTYLATVSTSARGGYQLTQLDSYVESGTVYYAALFVQQKGPAPVTYADVDEATHVARQTQLAGQGYHPVNVTVVGRGGTRRVSALFAQGDVGAWVAEHSIRAIDLDAEVEKQKRAGLHLKALDAYTLDGVVYYSAVWDSLAWGAHESVSHGLSPREYQDEFDRMKRAGMWVRIVTGVNAGENGEYAAVWSD